MNDEDLLLTSDYSVLLVEFVAGLIMMGWGYLAIVVMFSL